MAFRTLIAIASAAALTAASASFAQSPPDRKTLFEQQRKQYREGVLQYPLLKQKKIDEVFHLKIDDGQLTIEPLLDADREYQQRRAELDGLSEPAVILCWLISQDLGQVQFELNVDDYSDPAAFGRLHLLGRPSNTSTGTVLENVDIEKIWQTPTGFRRVFFTQANGSARLVIFANDGGPNGFINLNLSEKDFATLRRNHHAETERWLRPILRELHQEAAFAADPATAWQVLAEDWPADPKYAGMVSEKIGGLDEDNFRIRRQTSNALQKLGREGALVMLKMDRSSLSVEQNLRLNEVIARFKPLTDAESRRLCKDPSFLLDCLYGDDPTARKLALDRLRALSGQPIEFDLSAKEDARITAVNALREKFFPPTKPGAKP